MKQIKKSFSGVEVLHGVDFELREGEVHALIGHNGAGKSTLMRVLGGVYPDYEGIIAVDGAAVRLDTPKGALDNGIAVIYQDFSLIPDLDVAHNIALGREPKFLGGALVDHGRLERRSQEEADRFGISLPMQETTRALGVAAQQQTEIVRALARNARFLVMDEPTARLAPREREQLFAIMKSLTSQGVGIVYISHFLDEVTEVADRITVLRDGAVSATLDSSEATPDSLARLLVGTDEALVALAREESDSASGKVVLEVKELAVRGRAPMTFEVHAGEIVALAGLVGSGRTRIARAIIGETAATGTVAVRGTPVARRSPGSSARAGLLLVPEDRKRNGLVLTSSIRQNIELTSIEVHLSRFGIVRRAARKKLVDAAMTRFAIRPHDQSLLVQNLSGGNAQKVLLARAVSSDPAALILDQPTAGVDIGAKTELHQQIVRLAESGAGVVVISDDLDEMLVLADRLLIIVNGELVSELPGRGASRAELLRAISVTKGDAA